MNPRIQFIFIFGQIFYLSFLFAAENEYQFEIITTRNGLSDNDIRAVTDDRYGFVWLATDEGFNRYDGYEVKSYNSNPLSLKSAILNYDKIDTNKSKKYLLLGDMLELGRHSKKLHQSIIPIINQTKIDKVFVKGNKAILIFKGLLKTKKG